MPFTMLTLGTAPIKGFFRNKRKVVQIGHGRVGVHMAIQGPKGTGTSLIADTLIAERDGVSRLFEITRSLEASTAEVRISGVNSSNAGDSLFEIVTTAKDLQTTLTELMPNIAPTSRTSVALNTPAAVEAFCQYWTSLGKSQEVPVVLLVNENPDVLAYFEANPAVLSQFKGLGVNCWFLSQKALPQAILANCKIHLNTGYYRGEAIALGSCLFKSEDDKEEFLVQIGQ